ncbi:MAG: hypothetical protein GY749_46335 [Desulfobacteraceae bacterium]|nr:hypothetical protein [Desulfobacteraceae bacterium]
MFMQLRVAQRLDNRRGRIHSGQSN